MAATTLCDNVTARNFAYYAPYGNLAIFVEDGTGNYAGDLMRLGAVETGLPALQCSGPLQIRIKRMPNRSSAHAKPPIRIPFHLKGIEYEHAGYRAMTAAVLKSSGCTRKP